jgi:putative addiction module component (TIGR02574 family)
MTSESILNEIEKLDIAERILLIEAAWNNICLSGDKLPVLKRQKDEPDRRLSGHESDRKKCSPADKFAELRQLCLEENYSLELPDRSDRHNIFAGTRNELSL